MTPATTTRTPAPSTAVPTHSITCRKSDIAAPPKFALGSRPGPPLAQCRRPPAPRPCRRALSWPGGLGPGDRDTARPWATGKSAAAAAAGVALLLGRLLL